MRCFAVLLGLMFLMASGGASAKMEATQDSTQVRVESFVGGDIGAKIAAADAALGSKPGTITVNTEGVLSTPVSIHSGHSLLFHASVRVAVASGAAVELQGNNTVTCTKAVTLRISTPLLFSITGPHVSASGCDVVGSYHHMVHSTDEYVGKAFLVAAVDDVKVSQFDTTDVQLVDAHGSTHLTVSNNSVKGTTDLATSYGVVLEFDAAHALITGNTFDHIVNAVEYFNDEDDPNHNSKWPNTRAAVGAHGGYYEITKNTCTNSTSCYWGSVAHDVVMAGNSAENCTDVCYDAEGSIDVTISGNRGKNGTNGMGATFFYTDHVTFTQNAFESDSGQRILSINNSTGVPSVSEAVSIVGNTLRCTKLCQAIGQDPTDNLLIQGNSLQGGYIKFASTNGLQNAVIEKNDITLSAAGDGAVNGIGISQVLRGGKVSIAQNTLRSVAQPAGSSCIAITAYDFNSSVKVMVTGNKCLSGFPADITTTTGGGNNGTTATFSVSGNYLGSGVVVHKHTGVQRDEYTESGDFIQAAGAWRVKP